MTGKIMTGPEAVRKHDGRVVAFDSGRLAGSVARAASGAKIKLAPEKAETLGAEIARGAGALLASEGRIPSTPDIRALAMQILCRTEHEAVADAYSEFARAASDLLWRIRVVEPGAPLASAAGSPWDRRRLMESLRASGVARDPAGEAARDVERRVVALAQERLSPALIHALAALALAQRGIDPRPFSARRVAFSMACAAPRFDSAAGAALAVSGPALEGFWLQAVHSQEVARAARENLLSLEPYPSGPQAAPDTAAIDPLTPDMTLALREWCAQKRRTLCVRADAPERAGELARFLALLHESLAPAPGSGAALDAILLSPPRSPDTRARSQEPRAAFPVAINLAGLVIREALRDTSRATTRLAQLAGLAAQAHREREEYFNLSPVRGRRLPVALAGLWNATAWLQGESFECRHVTRAARSLAATLISVIRGAVDTLRNETGMELILAGSAPAEAITALLRSDREFLRRDGVTLDPSFAYDGGPALKLFGGAEDFAERADFAREAGAAFEQPPAVEVDVPLGADSDAAAWRELLVLAAQAGIPRLRLLPGGSGRGLRAVTRALRAHLEGYPLFEALEEKRVR